MLTLDLLFSTRKNNMNLIRLIAALSVIYGHAGAVTGGGSLIFFYVLLGTSLLAELQLMFFLF
jgi:hypothetical protein